MTGALLLVVLIAAAAAVAWLAIRRRQRVRASLAAASAAVPADATATGGGTTPMFPRRYRWAAPAVGGVVAVAVRVAVAWPLPIAVAFGLLATALVFLAEDALAGARTTQIEAQLAELIDMLVASLRSGAAVLAGFDASLHESRAPLRPYLEEVVGRVRFGEDPRHVIMTLTEQVPLETFRLFAMALAIHWEVGGSLAATLATVGRTIRDRIELDRRVRSQGIEAHASVAAVLAITYLLAYLMWQANPERVEAFVLTGVGTQLIALAVGLQAVGLLWMSRISRSGF